MPRKETEIMKDWEFALEDNGEKNFYKVDLPHDWAIQEPFQKEMEQGEAQGFRKRWGVGWYRRKLMIYEIKEGHRCFLDFGGIYEDSTVWVNGREAGGQKYGYSPFRLEVTELVHIGENEILIRVDNTKKPADRWYSGAGIYRTVKWVEVEEHHLEARNVVVKTGLCGTDGRITVDPGIDGHVRLEVRSGEESYEGESCGGRITLIIPNAKRWSAEAPDLYQLSLALMDGDRIADRITMMVGIREFSFIPNQGMFINGEPVVLKGVCVHQDVGCRGIAAVKEMWRERLMDLKRLGCNCIRPAHHIYAEEFLDLCDELGFYVYEECFDKWTGGLYGRYFETEWKKDITCMVERDRNRTCIFIWGVGNEVENQAQDSMIRILTMLKEQVLIFDDSRPVTYAMNPHFKRESNIDLSKVEDIQKLVDEEDDTEIYDMEEKLDRISKIAEVVDVISCNYQEQWYDKIHERFPEKLILGTEVYQFFKGDEKQMQNFTIENPSLVPLEKKYVIGGMIWTGIDYLGESMGYPAKGWAGSLIRTNGTHRASYYIMQSYWSREPMVYFAVLDYSLEDEGVKEHWDIPPYVEHWHFPQFYRTVVPYMVASNCEEVKLYINEKEFYLPKPGRCPNRLITGFLPYIPGKVTVVGYIQGQEVCRREVATPKTPVRLEFQEEENMEISCGKQRLLTVRACDENGNPYFRESSLVRFCAEGSGEILAVDNGNIMSNEPYNETAIHLYRGQASVLIKGGESRGTLRVLAWASGMRPAAIVCRVEQRYYEAGVMSGKQQEGEYYEI